MWEDSKWCRCCCTWCGSWFGIWLHSEKLCHLHETLLRGGGQQRCFSGFGFNQVCPIESCFAAATWLRGLIQIVLWALALHSTLDVLLKRRHGMNGVCHRTGRIRISVQQVPEQLRLLNLLNCLLLSHLPFRVGYSTQLYHIPEYFKHNQALALNMSHVIRQKWVVSIICVADARLSISLLPPPSRSLLVCVSLCVQSEYNISHSLQSVISSRCQTTIRNPSQQFLHLDSCSPRKTNKERRRYTCPALVLTPLPAIRLPVSGQMRLHYNLHMQSQLSIVQMTARKTRSRHSQQLQLVPQFDCGTTSPQPPSSPPLPLFIQFVVCVCEFVLMWLCSRRKSRAATE